MAEVTRQLPREAAVDVLGVQQLDFRVLRNVRTLSVSVVAGRRCTYLDAGSAPREAHGSAGPRAALRLLVRAQLWTSRTEQMGAGAGASEGGEKKRRNNAHGD